MKIRFALVMGTLCLLASCQLFESQMERRERIIFSAVDSCRQINEQSTQKQKDKAIELAQQAIVYVATTSAADFDEELLFDPSMLLKEFDAVHCDVLNVLLRFGIPDVARELKEQSQPVEQEEPDTPQSHEELDEVPDFLKEYEFAKQECADEGGQWVSSLHWDGWKEYGYVLRCLEESRLPANDPRWDDRLLTYDISVTYSRDTYKGIGFKRLAIVDESDSDNPAN